MPVIAASCLLAASYSVGRRSGAGGSIAGCGAWAEAMKQAKGRNAGEGSEAEAFRLDLLRRLERLNRSVPDEPETCKA